MTPVLQQSLPYQGLEEGAASRRQGGGSPPDLGCNSCHAHAAATAIETCLWKAAGSSASRPPTPVSVQQLIDCTNLRTAGLGTPLARINLGCNTGWADIHMNYTKNELGGVLNSAASYPLEPQLRKGECREDPAKNLDVGAKLTDFKVEFFRDEDDLEKLVEEGPVTTTIDATPHLQHFGGGTYYNNRSDTPCVDTLDEPVPDFCKELGEDGRVRYTCLRDGCREQMPKHCDR